MPINPSDCEKILNINSEIIWFQPSRLAQGRKNYTNNSDTIVYFTKPSGEPTFNLDNIRVPQLVDEKQRKRVESVPSVTGGKYNKTKYNEMGKNPGNVWSDIKQLTYKSKELVNKEFLNTIQKPEALIERIVKASSNKGDVVLDPFSGVGTTFAVCKKLERNFIGFEINPEYVERIAFYLDFPLCAKLLLNGGADLLSTQLIPKKRHTIVEAFKEGNSLCIPIILSLFSHIDSVSHAGIGNLLSVAATQKNKEAVDLLISLGANPDGKCTIDDSFIDCEHGVLNRIILSKLQTKEKIEMLEFMISRGANPYGIYTEHIEYPYEIASVIDAKILEWFYNKGINIAIKGREAILLASISENSDSLELLHSLGFDLNAKTKDGINAMMIASINNCFDNAVILIKKGIDFDPDVCLKLAIEHDSQDMIRLLLSVGADRKLLKKTKTPKKS